MRATKQERLEIRHVLAEMEAHGRLTPDNVIEEAKKPESPLHKSFTWEISEAARKTWLHEARTLIASFQVSIVINRKEYIVQEFVEHPTKAENLQGYASIATIKSNKAMAREFIERELTVASSYVNKTRDYAEILGLRARVETLLSDMESLRADSQGKQPSA